MRYGAWDFGESGACGACDGAETVGVASVGLGGVVAGSGGRSTSGS